MLISYVKLTDLILLFREEIFVLSDPSPYSLTFVPKIAPLLDSLPYN